MLEFYSASTSIVNSRRAITECLEVALAGQPSLDCDLIIMYSAMGHNFQELLDEALKLSPSAEIIGCTGCGVIGKEGPDESMKALAIMAIKGPKTEFATAGMDAVLEIDSYEVGSRLAKDIKGKNPQINMILFHPSSGAIPPAYRAIQGVESVFGPDIPIIGGLAFDNYKFRGDYEFYNEQVFETGAVMVGLADPTLEVLCQANHGFDIIGEPFEVTRSEGNLIYEYDGKPFWKAYTERLGLPESATFYDTAFAPLAVELPEELHDAYNSTFFMNGGIDYQNVRLDPDKGYPANYPIPEGTKSWITRRDEQQMMEGVDKLVAQALEHCDGRNPVAVFHADCAARGKMSFNRIHKDEIISRIQYPICGNEDIPWLGLYGGAEFSHLEGRNVVHSYTTSLYIIVRRRSEMPEKEIHLKPEIANESTLFKPATIKHFKLKNRSIAAATWMGLANHDGTCSPRLINRASKILRNEIGMYITEHCFVLSEGQCMNNQLGVHDDAMLPGLRRLAEEAHRFNTPILMQLVHGGLLTAPLLTGHQPVGPSILQKEDGVTGREMNTKEIKDTMTAFRDAAVRARKAGFDGVHVHAAHGFLLNQFLSPFFNKRNDEYGGSVENRARFLLETVSSIREATGDEMAVLVKINSEDLLPGGFCIDDMLAVSAMLGEAGVDAIELSGGNVASAYMGDMNNSPFPVGKKTVYYRAAAKRLKEKIKIPVILVGGIRSFKEAEGLLNEGIADFISLSRPLIREPDLVKRWKSGDLRDSECISDSACIRPGMERKGVHCVHLKGS